MSSTPGGPALIWPTFYSWGNRGIERGHIFHTVEDDIQPRRKVDLNHAVTLNTALTGSSN